MSVESTITKVIYEGNGTTVSWPVPFAYNQTEHLRLMVADAQGTGTEITDNFSVVVSGSGDTSILYPVSGRPLASGNKLVIYRQTPQTQIVDLQYGGAFSPETLENDGLDRIVMMLQEQQEELDRAVTVAIDSDESPEELLESIFDARDTAVESATSAQASAKIAAESTRAAAGSASIATEQREAACACADTAATEADRAKSEADRAQNLANIGPATPDRLGMVRIGQGIDVDENGVISTEPVTVATTDAPGIVQLSSAVDSTSETLAATPKAVKTAYDRAGEAASTASAAASVVAVALWGYATREKQFLRPSPTSRYGFLFRGGTYITLTTTDSNNIPQDIVFGSKTDVIFNDAKQLLDTGASFNVGRDYYIYAVSSESANKETINPINLVISLNSTYPAGYNADNSRKIGGFHTLCADVGTISDHPLSGFKAGDILPASFWDLSHRPACQPEGMVYISKLDFWADIYLQSGRGAATKSVFGGTITNTLAPQLHITDMCQVGKLLLSASEFICAALGSNNETAIKGAAIVSTTGGHVDTASRRMISNYGLEDCCGLISHWLRDFGPGDGGNWVNIPPGNMGDAFGAVFVLRVGALYKDSYHNGIYAFSGHEGVLEQKQYNSTRGCAKPYVS